MRASKPTNVSTFRIGLIADPKPHSAGLTHVVMHLFHIVDHLSGPNQTLNLGHAPPRSIITYRDRYQRLILRLDSRNCADWQLHHAKLANQEAVRAKVAPRLSDPVESVIAETRIWRIRRPLASSTNYPNWLTVKTTSQQCGVAAVFETLILNLPTRSVLSTMTGINYLVAKVFVVRVSTRDDDGLRTSFADSRNTSLKLFVDSTIKSVSPVDERRPLRNAGNLTKTFTTNGQQMGFDVAELKPETTQACDQLFLHWTKVSCNESVTGCGAVR